MIMAEKAPKLRPDCEPAPTQVVRVRPRVHCPFCRTKNVEGRHTRGRVRYYKCRECGDPATGKFSAFKVILSKQEPDA